LYIVSDNNNDISPTTTTNKERTRMDETATTQTPTQKVTKPRFLP